MHTLLLADDNATIRRVIELTFATEDITVVTVGDGEQAIARILADRPDIVLADIGMPKRNGYDVAAFVKGQPELAHIPVLLLAGAFEPVDSARAEQVKCDGVLVKPFEPQQVIARVRELVAGAQGAPTRATGDVPRPVERLTPLKLVENVRREKPETSTPVSGAAPKEPPAAAHRDGALDDYFDRLDAAFADLDTREPAQRGGPSDPRPAGSGPRLQSAEPRPAPIASDSVDDDLEVPTLEQLLGNEQPTATPAMPRNGTASPRMPIDLAQYSLPPLEERASPFAEPIEPSHPARPPSTTPAQDWPPAVPAPAAPVAAPSGPGASSPSYGDGTGEERHAMADAFTALLAAERGEPYDARALSILPKSPPAITEALVDELSRRVLERLAPEAVKHVVADVVADVAERLVKEEIARIRGGT
jgi:CheY-like chemotaxis protein